MTTAKKRGYIGQIYLQAGSHASPSWNQVAQAQDIKLGDAWETFEASSRASPVKKYLPAQQDLSVEFTFIWDSSDTDLLALRAYYRAGAAADMWIADGLSGTPGTSGPNCEWLITEFGNDMPLKDGQKVTCKCVPHANCSFEPEYLTTA